jgi:hypothetical protein
MPKNKGKGGKNRHRGNNENDVSENFCSCIELIGDEFDEKVLVPQSTPIDSLSSCITPRSSHVSRVNNVMLPSYDFKEEEVIKKILEITS